MKTIHSPPVARSKTCSRCRDKPSIRANATVQPRTTHHRRRRDDAQRSALRQHLSQRLPDRRRKSGADRLAWRVGDVFFCTHRAGTVTFNDSRGFRLDPIDLRHPSYVEFTAALEELPESTEDALSCVPAWGPASRASARGDLFIVVFLCGWFMQVYLDSSEALRLVKSFSMRVTAVVVAFGELLAILVVCL